ncbi:hypothetical protein J7J49_06665 [Halomonas sp. ISL-56]|uniref:hypothetical protein n=1 Tax=Halomonas sp. ISL-56 TaxID=2819149 RepID=UPI001BEBA3C4|nr:hypothetical protein [Halomonas sp. ISL-56]MBT2800999.1 hypothetical protein [Halomonas sp. ISL-56]
MVRFLTGMAAGGLVILILWVVFWAGQLGRPHPNNEWIIQSISYKQKIANELLSPKIVVLAGSGAMFGINSTYLEETYGRPAVNLGVNAGISLPVILNSAEHIIQSGDLVLLPLEYPLYNRKEAVSSSLIHWANSYPRTFLQLPLKRALEVFAKTSFSRILEGYRGLPEGFTVSGDYGVQHQDEHGDQIGTDRALREERHWNFLNSLPAETYGKALREGSFDWVRLRRFRDELLARGACPVFLPPPLLFKPSYVASPTEADFYETLPFKATSEGLFWLGRPTEAMRDANAFFDTNFHLVNEARLDYTKQIVDWLGNQPMEQCKQYYQGLTTR